MIGKKIKKINTLELQHSLWVSLDEDSSARHNVKRYETATGNVIQYVRKRNHIPLKLEAKNNDWISETEKEAIEQMFNNFDTLTLKDENDVEHTAIFDYDGAISFTPISFGMNLYYPELNLILTEEN